MHAPFLLAAAVIAAAAWLLLFAVAAAATRAKDVDPGPPGLSLGGDESPALVNMLAGSWKVSHEAVPATFFDLAARGFLEIQEVGAGRVICHLRQRDPAGLLPYERRVLDHLRSLAVDGVVPAEALTTGPEHHSAKWWSGFRREVIADARARGLSRDRWSAAIWGFFGFLAVAPAGLFAVWIHGNVKHDGDDDPRFGIFLVIWFGLMWLLGNSRDQRDTAPGREVAARWLGLREHLSTNPVIPTLGPGAVAIWDRILAYAAAFGLAEAAVRAIPLGEEDDRQAWTSYGGAWRRVTVNYPRRRPAWGSSPWQAIGAGVLWIGLSIFILIVSNLFRTADDGSPIGRGLSLFGWAVGFACLVFLTYWGCVVWFAFTDLVTPEREVEGQVLRLRRFGSRKEPAFFCAVYDGSRDRVDAWKVGAAIYGSLSQFATVRARITRRLACVRSIEVLESGRPAPPDTDSATDVAAPVAVLEEAAKLFRGKRNRK